MVATFTDRPADGRVIETQVLLLERLDGAVQGRDVRITGTAVYSESVAACAIIQVVSSRSTPRTVFAEGQIITIGFVSPCLGI